MIANMYAESNCDPLCIEGKLIKRYKEEGFLKWDYPITDENTYKQYWSYYDSGAISEKEFISPRQYTGVKHQYGAGLCQWTTSDRKKLWISLAKNDSKPLTDIGVQLNLLYYELHHTYTNVWSVLHQSINVDISTNYVLRNFEQPANAGTLLNDRLEYAKEIQNFLQEDNKVPIIIGSARIDENGHAHGGKAGDQTGKEVSTQEYYLHSGGWRAFRFKNPNYANKVAYAMKAACDNNNWGYDQYERTSGMQKVAQYGYDPAKLNSPAETDCSNLVRTCFRYATGKDPGDFDTSGEASALKATGLVNEVSFNQSTGSGLCTGDILVTRKKGHTVIVVSGAKRSGITVAQPEQIHTVNGSSGYMFEPALIKLGSKNNSVLLFQKIYNGANVGYKWSRTPLATDGICGAATVDAIKWYQKQRGLSVDGECGKNTWKDLIAI